MFTSILTIFLILLAVPPPKPPEKAWRAGRIEDRQTAPYVGPLFPRREPHRYVLAVVWAIREAHPS